MNKTTALHRSFVALAAVVACAGVAAAEATAPADPAKPVTTVRVGGSEADAAFRTAQQQSGDRYRQARTACAAQAGNARGACLKTARADLKQARLEAKATHDAAVRRAP